MASLSFYHSSRMDWWPAAQTKGEVDSLMIGDYEEHPDGGVLECGEFGIRWHDLGGRHGPSPRLEMFGDSWACLTTPHGAALVAWLAANHKKPVQPEAVCAFLRSIGCKDRSDKDSTTFHGSISGPGFDPREAR